MFNIFKNKEKAPKNKESLLEGIFAILSVIGGIIIVVEIFKMLSSKLGFFIFLAFAVIVFGAKYLKKKGIIKKSFKIQ